MNIRLQRIAAAALALVIAWLPMHNATAGMIDTGTAIAAAQQQQGNRERVQQFLARADVQTQMERLGVSASAAAERVDRLTEAEVQRIAGQIDTAPAGAIGSLIVIVLLGILVWFLVIR